MIHPSTMGWNLRVIIWLRVIVSTGSACSHHLWVLKEGGESPLTPSYSPLIQLPHSFFQSTDALCLSIAIYDWSSKKLCFISFLINCRDVIRQCLEAERQGCVSLKKFSEFVFVFELNAADVNECLEGSGRRWSQKKKKEHSDGMLKIEI